MNFIIQLTVCLVSFFAADIQMRSHSTQLRMSKSTIDHLNSVGFFNVVFDNVIIHSSDGCHIDLCSIIFCRSILISFPLDQAWTVVRIWDRRVSLMSSNWPNRPALKNTWEERTKKITWLYYLVLIWSPNLQILHLLQRALQSVQHTTPSIFRPW